MTIGSVTVAADGTVTKSGTAELIYDTIVSVMAAKAPPVVPAGDADGAPMKQSFADLANCVAPAVEGGMPTGAIVMWAKSTDPPTGWLVCDGSAVSRTTYAGLFAVISTAWGIGDGSTTFNLPNCLGASPLGAGTGKAADATAHTFATWSGTETHTLVSGEMPSHTHTIADHAHGTDGGSTHFLTKASGVGSYDAAAGTTYQHQSATGTTSLSPASTGGGGAHNNLHPHFVLHFIIKT